ncbi:MinD/ParA family ATP-binding protein [Paenibacillus glucanolyticus]|uniref:MinD/ParA family ATP-binding protein n=1 Tax=Paenibacillus glucanolyticus TaxID=59843 RepID=UPI00096C1003|nr:hypothetical protein [Paenibacillus glucanolyticus]OMF76755.1 hypothetical protein BK142_14645 [Paenibacillus glucanolyticus]
MGQIAFWSPYSGSGQTSSIAAIAAALSSEYHIRCLIAQTKNRESTLEHSFSRSINNFSRTLGHVSGSRNVSGTGLDAVLRIARSGKLEGGAVKNNTQIIEQGRLDILSSSDQKDAKKLEEASDLIRTIFDQASKYYNVILLDLPAGDGSEISRKLIASSDVVVICLPQSRRSLDAYFEKKNWPSTLNSKKTVLLFTQHDPHSKYKAVNITRKYKSPKGLIVPYNTTFKDSVNDGDTKGFYKANKAAERRHPNYDFVFEVQRAAKQLLDEIGIDSKTKRIDAEERGAS